MSPTSVQSLGQWLYSRGQGNASHGSPMQVRLDLGTENDLGQLAEKFGMAKATLAQELLRAAVQDVKATNPANIYATAGDVFDEDEIREKGIDPDGLLSDPDTGEYILKGDV